MKIITEIVAQSHPLWALQALVHFPFDTADDYDKQNLEQIKGTILTYLHNFEYKQRNTTFKLENTHLIIEQEKVITVTSADEENIILYIAFADKPEYGKCIVCGYTQFNACYHPDYGSCWWIGEKCLLCSHCANPDIYSDPNTEHAITQ